MSVEPPKTESSTNGAVPPPPPPPTPDSLPTRSTPSPEPDSLTPRQRAYLIGGVIFAILIFVGLIAFAVFLVNNPAQASVWRDVFIIFMALEMILIGGALVVLMIQLAALTNLLKNEVKPILEATQETVNTVRGTTIFVSENLTEPIM
ncbi:MAG: hypothetical protein JNL09_07635, partial [Anaerolineales bacterium]|nr:hypothetical protein [Anaerolineales bacterium]